MYWLVADLLKLIASSCAAPRAADSDGIETAVAALAGGRYFHANFVAVSPPAVSAPLPVPASLLELLLDAASSATAALGAALSVAVRSAALACVAHAAAASRAVGASVALARSLNVQVRATAMLRMLMMSDFVFSPTLCSCLVF